jgi:hypothetical protein
LNKIFDVLHKKIPSGIPIAILKIAAVPSKASVVIAFTQKPKKPM